MPRFIQPLAHHLTPSCEPVKDNRFSYLTLNMNHTLNALNGCSSHKWVRIAQSIARITIFPLFLIAAFEGIVKNGFFLFVNLGVALANKIYQIIYPLKKTEVTSKAFKITNPPSLLSSASIPEKKKEETISGEMQKIPFNDRSLDTSLPKVEARSELLAQVPVSPSAPTQSAMPVDPQVLASPLREAPNAIFLNEPAGHSLLAKPVEWKKIAAVGAAILSTFLLGPGATASLVTTAL